MICCFGLMSISSKTRKWSILLLRVVWSMIKLIWLSKLLRVLKCIKSTYKYLYRIISIKDSVKKRLLSRVRKLWLICSKQHQKRVKLLYRNMVICCILIVLRKFGFFCRKFLKSKNKISMILVYNSIWGYFTIQMKSLISKRLNILSIFVSNICLNFLKEKSKLPLLLSIITILRAKKTILLFIREKLEIF